MISSEQQDFGFFATQTASCNLARAVAQLTSLPLIWPGDLKKLLPQTSTFPFPQPTPICTLTQFLKTRSGVQEGFAPLLILRLFSQGWLPRGAEPLDSACCLSSGLLATLSLHSLGRRCQRELGWQRWECEESACSQALRKELLPHNRWYYRRDWLSLAYFRISLKGNKSLAQECRAAFWCQKQTSVWKMLNDSLLSLP